MPVHVCKEVTALAAGVQRVVTGARVCVAKLKKHPQRSHQYGTVADCDGDNDLWNVRLDNGLIAVVAEKNLIILVGAEQEVREVCKHPTPTPEVCQEVSHLEKPVDEVVVFPHNDAPDAPTYGQQCTSVALTACTAKDAAECAYGFLCTEVVASITKVTPNKFAIKADVFADLDGLLLPCTATNTGSRPSKSPGRGKPIAPFAAPRRAL